MSISLTPRRITTARGRRLAALTALSGTLSFGVAPALGTSLGSPAVARAQQADTATKETSSQHAPSVEIEDADHLISDSDKEKLTKKTPKIDFQSPHLTHVVYLAMPGKKKDKFNDEVLEWAAQNKPELVPHVPGKGEKWADGYLLVTVGTETRQNGIYCGDDVCEDLDLRDSKHLKKSLDDGKPAFKDKRWGDGLLDSATTAADPNNVPEDKPTSPWVYVALGGGAIAAVGGGAYFERERRKKIAETAREQFTKVSKEYADLAQRLDHIDVRAHSLSSPIADQELRRQWTSIRDNFLTMNERMGEVNLNITSSAKSFWDKRKQIESMHSDLEKLSVAEGQIDQLFDMENGNTSVRKRTLNDLQLDVAEAKVKLEDVTDPELLNKAGTSNLALKEMLRDVEVDIQKLMDYPDAPDFMDRFALLLTRYHKALELVGDGIKPVSYTHLTLPTILLV